MTSRCIAAVSFVFILASCGGHNIALDPEYMPIRENLYWVYEVSSTGRPTQDVKLSVGKKVKLEAGGEKVEAWQLYIDGEKSSEYLVESDEGFRVVRKDQVDFVGTLAIITLKEVKWEPKEWEYRVWSNCTAEDWTGRRVENSMATDVPAGTFDCAQIDLEGSKKYNQAELLFSPGIGMVFQKVRSYDDANGWYEEVWSLKSNHPDLKMRKPKK